MALRTDSFACHRRAMRATESHALHLEERLALLAECVRTLMNDRQFAELLNELGYKVLPRHIHDCLK